MNRFALLLVLGAMTLAPVASFAGGCYPSYPVYRPSHGHHQHHGHYAQPRYSNYGYSQPRYNYGYNQPRYNNYNHYRGSSFGVHTPNFSFHYSR